MPNLPAKMSPTGYDQALALSWNLHQADLAVLTLSRPGYVRTPLATGPTPEQAADAAAGLLDVLGLDRVGVIGTSGGGPTALQFALRHPQRVWGLVLQSAVTQSFIEPRRSTHSLIGTICTSMPSCRSIRWKRSPVQRWCCMGAPMEMCRSCTPNSSLAPCQRSNCSRSRIEAFDLGRARRKPGARAGTGLSHVTRGPAGEFNRADGLQYILRFIVQVITVRLETVKIVKSLPPLQTG